ncbi:autotransporter assembly complex protein TamA [Sphingobium boeckii]|uniref:Translocation and assembly module TamA n=1 Tax=Sphingobium boeckii TaxID=1082345 RepID=A0A7W9AHX6_9SPHN|nr:autotransporter assembly complex family protein [Sphingobium boeckii]MBB5686018.1 translocation and assembly module TamA [Sphingobium boeckii]
MALSAAPGLSAQDAPPPALTLPAEDGNMPSLDPDAPLAEMPDLGVEWPDLTDMSDLPDGQAAGPVAQTEIADQRRYEVRLDGLGDLKLEGLRTQFDALSTLENAKGKTANIAQIDRRAREDQDLLSTLMRAYGYYAARVDTRVETEAGGKILVILDTEPGPVYTFTDVQLPGIEKTGDKAAALEESFGVDAADPVDAGKVLAGEAAVRAKIGREGFPFAKIGAPEVLVDHDERTATLVMTVDPGAARNFGQINVANTKVFGAKHLQTIARFKPGEPYDSEMVDDLRRALIQTGLISSAKIEPVPGVVPDTVDLNIALEPAPPRTIAGELGYGTGEGIRLEASWQHRNFIKPEGAVTFRGVAGTQEQLLSTTLRRNNFGDRDRVLNGQVAVSNINRNAYAARTFTLSGNLERQTNIIFQKKWIWSLGGELIASDERGIIGNAVVPVRRTFFIGALPSSLNYDGSDDLLNPTKGFRVGARISPEASFQSGTFGYLKAQIDASGYFPVSDTIVIAGRGRMGTIYGADRDRIAPSRRFYAGGGGSVRGYSYQSIGPRDVNNDPIGGRSLAEFSLEARVRFGAFGVVPFVDAGNISSGGLPSLKNMRIGAGIGARYYTNFGPIRIDVGTPINPQKGDPRIAVYVSLGQAF